jgi:hypothetical protein
MACKEHHQVGNSAVINVGVGTTLPLVRIRVEVPHHVFMNLLLEIDPDGTVAANHFISADPGVRGHIPARVRNVNVVGYVTYGMVGPLACGYD